MKTREYKIMYELEDRHFWFLGKRYYVDNILKNHTGPVHKILDLGSGTGGMTKHIEKYGEVLGIEKDPIGRNLSKKRGLKVLRGDINKLLQKSSTFDLVTLFDVLYHKNIKNEGVTLSECHRVLKPNGLLLITDSAMKVLKSHHDLATHGKRRYSVPEITKIVEKQNFKVLRASYIFSFLFPIIFFKRKILDRLLKDGHSDVSQLPRLVNNLMLMIVKIEAFLFKYTNLPFGTSVIVIAQKKP